MPQFTLRHLFLLTSFFCLWFAVYSYWRHPMIFTLPYYVGIVGLVGCVIHGTKEESKRIKRIGVLTLLGVLCAVAGMVLREVYFEYSTPAIFMTFLIGVFLQAGYLCTQCFHIGVTTSQGRAVGFVLLFLFLNLMVMGTSFVAMTPISQIR